MKKRIIILLEEMIEDSEFLYPWYRLLEAGFEVTTAAPELKTYLGKGGMKFKPEKSFSEIKNNLYDALIIPGGYAPDRWRRDPEICAFVTKHHQAQKLIASICHGPWLMISAQIVKDRRITAFSAIKDDLINAGARYTGADWEEDDNLLSCTNPKTMLPMMKRLVERLNA